jgi:hypothetical protein
LLIPDIGSLEFLHRSLRIGLIENVRIVERERIAEELAEPSSSEHAADQSTGGIKPIDRQRVSILGNRHHYVAHWCSPLLPL